MLFLIFFGLFAQASPFPSIRNYPTEPQALAAAIQDDDIRFRKYAARTLKSDIRKTVRKYKSNDPMMQLEQRQYLSDLEMHTVPACITQLTTKDIGGMCADILRYLEADEALKDLETALDSSPLNKRHHRKIEKAISSLKAL